jgi:diacylglycerol kinase family enzyme
MRWRMPDSISVDSIPVILNARAGAGTGAAAVREAFARQGLHAQLHVCEGGDALDGMLDTLLAQRPRIVVAGGGDGTVTSVAARLLDGDSVLGVLPLGTLNHFAKDLELPLDLDGAAHAIATGEPRRVDVGEVNGEVFLNNSSLGLYPRIVVDREVARRRLHLGKWPALLRATWRALRHPHALTVTLRVDGTELRRRTPFLFIGNNRYILQGLEAGSRPRLDGGLLSLHVLREQSPMGFVWLALRTLCGRMSAGRDFESHVAEAFQVDATGGGTEVACDGEVARLSLPLRYRVRPRALRVLVPPKEGAR